MSERALETHAVAALDRLCAIEAIRVLKARYFRYVDTKDRQGLASLFAENAALDMSEAAGGEADKSAIVKGAAEIANFILAATEGATTVHLGGMPEIHVLSPTSASAVWAMTDHLRWPDEFAMPFHRMTGHGHYHDTYVRVHGEWRIQSSKLTRLRVDVV
ncbi:nuclear transport factor 2 family protein [Pandoraea captiosa]|uniref:Nuclear transport factor 2 family protein n=1 Tax=Pandoraea captiosa TaxID=2508302 RepID=A0A5E5ABV0_9BURK|nr:nuclear transport factor 2 family protein [Pandoraea captiosa]VVE70025.1 nuclear transport factor 2 family protein [Pandoraea captiosa]